MTRTLDDILGLYDYSVPPQLIAQSPAHPRDSAKLLVYDRKSGKTSFTTFASICDYLPQNAVLVFNKTKVFPARMRLKKGTGGAVSALYIERRGDDVWVIADGSFKKGDVLSWEGEHYFDVIDRDGKFALLHPSFSINDLPTLLEKFGETPLPPYIKQSPLNEAERREEYQTVFAKDNGSVAAPTAGLHFTENLIANIAKTHAIAYITLHVNLGTFAPLTEEHWQQKKLHEEWYDINAATMQLLIDTKKSGRPIIAVGTTTVRALESAFHNFSLVQPCDSHGSTGIRGTTSIFLHPDNPPRFINGLITNFHVPRSSLLMLVAALTGREKLLELYAQAIEKKFRFFSFGDGMMIL